MKKLAVNGGNPETSIPKPHFTWPPSIPGLSDAVKQYIDGQNPLSIAGRTGIYQELEDKFCSLLNRKYAILTSSGTMALYSAFFGLNLMPGDEVISTVYSFHATATPLLHFGVQIIFCDVESDTGNIDPHAIENLITDRTRAVVTNHMWGHPVDVTAISSICARHEIAWVEDCSHAHFAQYRNRYVGTFGDVSVFSLQGNKLLSGGEGGILLTDDTDIYERATLLGHSLKRSMTCVKNPEWGDILRTGFGLKFRMHPLAAVIVNYMLDHFCFDWIKFREQTLARFSEGLAATGKILPMTRREYVSSMGAHYGFKPRVDFTKIGVNRNRLVHALQAEGLDIKVPGSPPFNELALFDAHRFQISHYKKNDQSNQTFPGARAYYQSILSLPTFTFPDQWPILDQYVSAFHKIMGRLEEVP
jgi:dTDP-4-amino-4,6-dideoxygalactose transaminase